MQLVYRPIAALIRRIFQHPVLAGLATYHAEHPRSAANDVCDFQDGAVYAEDILGDPAFAADPRNLTAALVTDGMQPYQDDRKYSMWPVVITFYNFPPHVRYKLAVTSLLCVVPGSRLDYSTLNLQHVLQIPVDEFKLLRFGLRLQDASRNNESFTCRAKLVQVCGPAVVLGAGESHVTAWLDTPPRCACTWRGDSCTDNPLTNMSPLPAWIRCLNSRGGRVQQQ